MFFFLSKTVYFLAKPFTWIVLAFVLSIFIRRRRKQLFGLGLGLLIFFSNPFISNAVMRIWEVDPRPIATLPTYEVGIVLGGITTDKEPRDRVHVPGSADRVLHAVQLYRQGKIRKILVSGGSGKLIKDQVSEAVLLARLLRLSGVRERHIMIESESRNTRENALYCAQVLNEHYPPADTEYLLITSAYHMHRAEACFRKVGLVVSPFGVDFRSDAPRYTPDLLLLPSVAAIESWEVVIREMIGILAYAVVGYV